MKIDVVTIFPEYLDPLRLSLVGKAVTAGTVELGVHDLRRWTSDRHRTVDDTPYGGGAGMVMRPEPWGQALDALTPGPGEGPTPRLVVLTPSGRRFTQAVAAELAAEPHLVLACGRYEGIDARVAAYAAGRMRVDELSIGDYVLNGGEAAALAVVEAVVRLLPGVIGNPASLEEESHSAGHDGLLEYPVYTKPPSWRGLDVPAVLFSGHHGRIAAWRREQALARTRAVRPDLVPPALDALVWGTATPADAGELFTLQRAAYFPEGQRNGSFTIPPLTETLDALTRSLDGRDVVLTVRRAGRLLGSVRGSSRSDGVWYVGRLMVAPDVQGRGIGATLLRRVEALAPPSSSTVRLIAGAASRSNLRFYRRAGYRVVTETVDEAGVPIVVLERPVGPAAEEPAPR